MIFWARDKKDLSLKYFYQIQASMGLIYWAPLGVVVRFIIVFIYNMVKIIFTTTILYQRDRDVARILFPWGGVKLKIIIITSNINHFYYLRKN